MASITKRGRFWRVQIIRKGYPPQYRTFDTEPQAAAWARHIENEMDRGVFASRAAAERTTLADALERYWQEVAKFKKHPDQERRRINHWLRQSISRYALANLRGSEFARYRDERRESGRAENTIRLELALVSHLFEIARKEWGMESLQNPLRNIRKPSGSAERDRRLQPGEYEAIKAELKKSDNPWVQHLFDFAIETALRQGMLFNLHWDWVDLPRRHIAIPADYRLCGNKGVPSFLPLSTRAIQVLETLPKSASGKIFDTTQNALVMVWKKSLRRLNIRDLRWHDLRHEAASRLFEKGLHPIEVAAITGHKSMNMLRRYTHLNPYDLAQKLG